MKTWHKPGFSPYFTQWKPDFTGFVPGTNPVCPRDNPGDEGAAQKVYVKKVYVPFSLASSNPNSAIYSFMCQYSERRLIRLTF